MLETVYMPNISINADRKKVALFIALIIAITLFTYAFIIVNAQTATETVIESGTVYQIVTGTVVNLNTYAGTAYFINGGTVTSSVLVSSMGTVYVSNAGGYTVTTTGTALISYVGSAVVITTGTVVNIMPTVTTLTNVGTVVNYVSNEGTVYQIVQNNVNYGGTVVTTGTIINMGTVTTQMSEIVSGTVTSLVTILNTGTVTTSSIQVITGTLTTTGTIVYTGNVQSTLVQSFAGTVLTSFVQTVGGTAVTYMVQELTGVVTTTNVIVSSVNNSLSFVNGMTINTTQITKAVGAPPILQVAYPSLSYIKGAYNGFAGVPLMTIMFLAIFIGTARAINDTIRSLIVASGITAVIMAFMGLIDYALVAIVIFVIVTAFLLQRRFRVIWTGPPYAG